jgi:phosphoribosylaminoimidazolecarboxamide formyltransferase/IMP cyclohydrolase
VVKLRYGINPGQAAIAEPVVAGEWPVRVVNGEPSYINVLDALNGWQLVREASLGLGKVAAASFKHVSPAGAALAGDLDEVAAGLYGVQGGGVGELTSAYLRARDADPKSSYGDFVAVSRPVDAELAEVLGGLVSDGIIAPGFEPGTVERLSRKKNGRFLVMEVDRGVCAAARRGAGGVRRTPDAGEAPGGNQPGRRRADGDPGDGWECPSDGWAEPVDGWGGAGGGRGGPCGGWGSFGCG